MPIRINQSEAQAADFSKKKNDAPRCFCRVKLPDYNITDICPKLANKWGKKKKECIGVDVGTVCPPRLDAFLTREFSDLLQKYHQSGTPQMVRAVFAGPEGLLPLRLIQGRDWQEVIIDTPLPDRRRKKCG